MRMTKIALVYSVLFLTSLVSGQTLEQAIDERVELAQSQERFHQKVEKEVEQYNRNAEERFDQAMRYVPPALELARRRQGGYDQR